MFVDSCQRSIIDQLPSDFVIFEISFSRLRKLQQLVGK